MLKIKINKMKQLFIVLFVLIGYTAKSQTISSTITGGTYSTTSGSTASGEVIIPKGAIEILPIVVSVQGDSAYSFSWMALQVTRDTTVGFTAYVMLYDKAGKSITQINQEIPKEIANQWGYDPTPIDDYIFTMNPRFKRKTK